MVVFSHNNLRAVKTLRPFVFGFELNYLFLHSMMQEGVST